MVREIKKKFKTSGFYQRLVSKVSKENQKYTLTQLASDINTEKSMLDRLDKCEEVFEKRFDSLKNAALNIALTHKVDITDLLDIGEEKTVNGEKVNIFTETFFGGEKDPVNILVDKAISLDEYLSDNYNDDEISSSTPYMKLFSSCGEIYFSLSKSINGSKLKNTKQLIEGISKKIEDVNEYFPFKDSDEVFYSNIGNAIKHRELEYEFDEQLKLLRQKGLTILFHSFYYWFSEYKDIGTDYEYIDYTSKKVTLFIFGQENDEHNIIYIEGTAPPKEEKDSKYNMVIDGKPARDWYDTPF